MVGRARDRGGWVPEKVKKTVLRKAVKKNKFVGEKTRAGSLDHIGGRGGGQKAPQEKKKQEASGNTNNNNNIYSYSNIYSIIYSTLHYATLLPLSLLHTSLIFLFSLFFLFHLCSDKAMFQSSE